jgi:hypothetical protein
VHLFSTPVLVRLPGLVPFFTSGEYSSISSFQKVLHGLEITPAGDIQKDHRIPSYSQGTRPVLLVGTSETIRNNEAWDEFTAAQQPCLSLMYGSGGNRHISRPE